MIPPHIRESIRFVIEEFHLLCCVFSWLAIGALPPEL